MVTRKTLPILEKPTATFMFEIVGAQNGGLQVKGKIPKSINLFRAD